MSTLWRSAVRHAYTTALRLATPLYLARLWQRGFVEPGYREALGERLGVYRGRVLAPGLVWVHAVSLGETRAAMPLIDALRAQQPGLRLLLTHGTATGRMAGAMLLRTGDLQAWLPYDTPGAVQRFLRQFKPTVGVLMETELWPTLLRQARLAQVPMVMANARLNERSARTGQRFASLLHAAAEDLTLVLAQSTDDADRLRAAGAPRVLVSGNLKFDVTPSPQHLDRGLEWRHAVARPVVLMASSREGEEAKLLDAWKALPGPRPLLLLVPRHPQRFDEVAELVAGRGLALQRRSSWNAMPPSEALDSDVWLGDSVGEMALYYAASDVALLGGSFEPLGGQNLIEAAACGCPVVMGPNTFNFAQAARQAEQAGAALRVDDLPQAVAAAVDLAGDLRRNDWVQRSLTFASAHRGAARAMAHQVLALRRLPGSAPASEPASADFRASDNTWFGLSTRARIIVYNKLTVKPGDADTYEALADPKNKGRVCTRSGSHPYNLTLFASLLERHGEARTRDLLKGIVDNMARAPKGGDTDQIRAVASGECAIALTNSYYWVRLLKSRKPEDVEVAARVGALFPNQQSGGTQMNLAGGAVARHAPHRAQAVQFLEYLASDSAQQYFADGNNEWPVVRTVKVDNAALNAMGEFKEERTSIEKLGKRTGDAQKLLDQVGYK